MCHPAGKGPLHERNHDIYEREFLGVYMPLMKYRPHLAATELPVTILTDHANLLHWKSPRKVNRRVARWFSDLQDFNLIFKHVPGKIHAAPDMLSRPPGADKGEHDNEAVTLIPEALFVKTAITTPSAIRSQVLTAQEQAHNEMEDWCDTQGARKLPEGYVKDNRWAVPTDEQLRREVLSQYHDSPTAGHPGRDNTIALVSQHYWWPRMNAWIEQYVKGCATCQQNKIRTTKNKTLLYCIPGDPTEQPFSTIAMDLITQLPKSNGHDAILTIVDQGCSRAALFLPCNTTITGEGIAKLYLQHVFPWFGVPSKMILDRDPRFTSSFGKALTTKLKIDRNISTAFHPQTDGLSERNNQWVEQYLRMYTTARQDDWDKWLPIASFVHNRWPNATTKMSPHEVLLGYAPAAAEAITPETNNAAAEDRQTIIKQHRKAAVQAITGLAQATPPAQYEEGEQVWLEAKHLSLPYQTAKLAPKRHGPFTILKQISPVAYKLELPPAWTIHPVFHASLLTPYKETTEHGTNYQRPPPEMIDDAEEYEVEQVISHRYHGRQKKLQYLICWKGYSAADDTWELADQVFADALVKAYHRKHPLDEMVKRKTPFTTRLRATLAKSPCLTARAPPLPHQTPTAPTAGRTSRRLCNALLQSWRPRTKTATSTLGRSASMGASVSSRDTTSPTSTPVSVGPSNHSSAPISWTNRSPNPWSASRSARKPSRRPSTACNRLQVAVRPLNLARG